MLFVHFTPKANLKRIKRTGLRPGKRKSWYSRAPGVYLRPLLRDEKTVVNGWNAPEWWPSGTAKHDHAMAKIVVRLPDDAIIVWGKESITVAEYGKILAREHRERFEKACRGEPSRAAWYDYWEYSCVREQVVYYGCIPRNWIVKIYDRSNTDERTRAYRRPRAKCRISESE